MPRNPLLFTTLLRMDLIEGIGSGIRLIYDLCREHQVTEPKITISEKFVTVTFFRNLHSEENATLSEPHQDSNHSESDSELIDNDTSPNSKFIQRFLEPSPPIHWDSVMPNPNLTRNYSELHSLLKNNHEKSHSDKGVQSCSLPFVTFSWHSFSCSIRYTRDSEPLFKNYSSRFHLLQKETFQLACFLAHQRFFGSMNLHQIYISTKTH